MRGCCLRRFLVGWIKRIWRNEKAGQSGAAPLNLFIIVIARQFRVACVLHSYKKLCFLGGIFILLQEKFFQQKVKKNAITKGFEPCYRIFGDYFSWSE